jgi:hypothetical protein
VGLTTKVIRFVCEKIAQNKCVTFNAEEEGQNKVRVTFRIFLKKRPEINNGPIGENMPNLVTLSSAYLASRVARIAVDVQLEVLVLVQEASPRLVDEKVVLVLLRDHVRVVAVAQRRPHLDRLPGNLRPVF